MPVVVGIDAGGTATRARALLDGEVVFEGRGGPGNAMSQSPAALADSFAQALDGCPPPVRVVACVAGASAEQGRRSAHEALSAVVPGADVRVLPDFAGAFHACPAGTDACVIAGTGSVACSPDGAGWRFSGGRGWLFGDHGSAAHLGKLLVRAYVRDPDHAGDPVRAVVRQHFGTDDWHTIVATVQSTPTPAPLLAALAPHVTALAAQGDGTALRVLVRSMAGLAGTVAVHLDGRRGARVGLSGGVWSAPVAVISFAAALEDVCSDAVLTRTPVEPLDGAVSLALRA